MKLGERRDILSKETCMLSGILKILEPDLLERKKSKLSIWWLRLDQNTLERAMLKVITNKDA